MTRSEALAAAAIFRVEMEAVLLEIFHHSIPTLSESVFRSKRKEIPYMVMPFWENTAEHSLHHEVPPHININPRNGHRSRNPRFSDTQHLHSNIAAKNVGTNTNHKTNRKSHIGHGRLWESINGSHYFHNESHALPTFEPEEAEHSFHRRTGEESIFVERLPGLEDSQQDPDKEFNPRRPPFGDPDDPDDDDDGNNPHSGGFPGGGPPNNPGNNGGGWHPRRPGGGHGFPRGGPPEGPPGGPFGGHHNPQNQRQQQDDGFKFEKKIKISEVPEWDGDTDKILEWLDDLNHLSFQSPRVHQELGMIAPLRLKGSAKAWFYALEPITQRTIQRSWADFKLALSTYFMNQQWFDKMKGRIL